VQFAIIDGIQNINTVSKSLRNIIGSASRARVVNRHFNFKHQYFLIDIRRATINVHVFLQKRFLFGRVDNSNEETATIDFDRSSRPVAFTLVSRNFLATSSAIELCLGMHLRDSNEKGYRFQSRDKSDGTRKSAIIVDVARTSECLRQCMKVQAMR